MSRFSLFLSKARRNACLLASSLALLGGSVCAVMGNAQAVVADSNANGYVDVANGLFNLHLNADTSFEFYYVSVSFYNTLGVGTSEAGPSNYHFSIGDDKLYGGEIKVGALGVYDTYLIENATLHFDIDGRWSDNAGYLEGAYCHWYFTMSEYGDRKFEVMRGGAYTRLSKTPAANELMRFGPMYATNGFGGTVTILGESGNNLSDESIRILTEYYFCSFKLGETPTAGDGGNISVDSVRYIFFDAQSIISSGRSWDYHVFDDLDVQNAPTFIDVPGFVMGSSSPNFAAAVIPYSVTYGIDALGVGTLEQLSFISVYAYDLADFYSFFDARSVPFWYLYTPSTNILSVFGGLQFLNSYKLDGSAVYNYELSWLSYYYEQCVLMYRSGITVGASLYYNLRVSTLGDAFYRLAVDNVWTAYYNGWNDGRIDLANNILTGTAYQTGYRDGQKAGYSEGYAQGRSEKTSTVFSLFGAVTSVPVNILNGLSPLVIWDTPIISIILTFLFIGVFLFIVKRFIS